MKCLDCYYHSYVGIQNWCCHPSICKRIKNPHANCADHIEWDFKGGIELRKKTLDEMLKIKGAQKNKSYELTHAGTAIRCNICGMTSFHLDDIEHKYCGKCRMFHDEHTID